MGVSSEALAVLMRSGPLPASHWADVKGTVVHVVITALRPEDATPCVVYRDAAGMVWVETLLVFTEKFKPAGGGGT